MAERIHRKSFYTVRGFLFCTFILSLPARRFVCRNYDIYRNKCRNLSLSLSLSLSLLLSPILSAQEFTYKEKKEMAGFPDYIMQAGYSPFRNWFVVCVGNNTLEIYDKNWKKVFTHQGNPKAVGGFFSFSPDERYLAYAKYKSENDIAIIRMGDLKVIQVLQGHSDFITDLTFSNNGKYLASSSQDYSVMIWEWQGDEMILRQSFSDHNKESATGVSFSFDDRFLASSGRDGAIVIRELKNGKYEPFEKFMSIMIETGFGFYYSVAFHPLRYDMITASHYGMKLWRLGKHGFETLDTIPEQSSSDTKLRLSPTGDYVAFGDQNQVRILPLENNHFLQRETIYRHSDFVFGAAFSEDGNYLVSYGSEKNIIIWELTGVRPSDKSVIAGCLDNRLTAAQKAILNPVILSKMMQRLDKNLLLTRDEFETTVEYSLRRQQLADAVLSMLQEYTEQEFGIIPEGKSGKVKIPIDRLIGYNADLGIYKVAFLETEAGIRIPVNEAKSFKLNWKKAYILSDKKTISGKKSYLYSNFVMVHPANGKEYEVIPVENPFKSEDQQVPKEIHTEKRNIAQTENFDISKTLENKEESAAVSSNHALLFATDQYDAFAELTNPVFDATTLSDELKESYGFDPELVVNPTLSQTIGKIREYAEKQYTNKDNLLIMFAGHGIFDEVFKEGYIISRDSRADDLAKTSYLSHSNLRTMVNNIPCPHIFLIMDVCFGGTFDPLLASGHRGADIYAGVTDDQFIARKMQYKTRIYLTSGGKEYVPDGRPGQHSPFTRKLLEALRSYGGQDKILTVNELLPFIEKVDPQPRFGEFGENEPGSDFIMISK